MIKTIKESFNITNQFLVIATPLILFSLISTIYLVFSAGGNSFGVIISIILFFLMFCAFLSGWFYMIKRAVKDPEMENKDKLITEFPSGVGEFFLPVIGMLINCFIIFTIILIVILLAGKHFIGSPGINYEQISSAMANIEAMKSFANSLNNEQLIKINQWNLLFLSGMFFSYFIVMFYSPAIFFKRKNPFIAFWISIKDIFGRHLFKNLGLFILIVIIYLLISILSAIFASNIVMHFIITLVNFYYITFVAILLFNYYYNHYAKIGSAIDKTV